MAVDAHPTPPRKVAGVPGEMEPLEGDVDGESDVASVEAKL